MGSPTLPASFQYLSTRYNGLVQVREGAVATDVPAAFLLEGNSERVNVLLVNNGANIVRVAINQNTLPAAGIELPAAGGRVELNLDQHGALVTAPLFAASLVGVSSVYIVTTTRVR